MKNIQNLRKQTNTVNQPSKKLNLNLKKNLDLIYIKTNKFNLIQRKKISCQVDESNN